MAAILYFEIRLTAEQFYYIFRNFNRVNPTETEPEARFHEIEYVLHVELFDKQRGVDRPVYEVVDAEGRGEVEVPRDGVRLTPGQLSQRAHTHVLHQYRITVSLPGLYSGKRLDGRAGVRGFKPRSSQTES